MEGETQIAQLGGRPEIEKLLKRRVKLRGEMR